MISSVTWLNNREVLEEGILRDIKSWISSSPQKLIEMVNNKQQERKDKLKQTGINPNKLSDICEDHAKQAWKEMNGKLDWKIASKSFKSCLLDCKKSAIEDIKSDESSFAEAIGLSLFTLFIVVIINSFMLNFFAVFFVSMGFIQSTSLVLSMCTTAILVSPITEESGKYFSVKHDYAGSYFLMFNIVEFANYVSSGTSMILRLLAIGLHGVLTMIHIDARKTGEEEARKNNNPELVNQFAINGAITAGILHFFWNFTASLPYVLNIISNGK